METYVVGGDMLFGVWRMGLFSLGVSGRWACGAVMEGAMPGYLCDRLRLDDFFWEIISQ